MLPVNEATKTFDQEIDNAGDEDGFERERFIPHSYVHLMRKIKKEGRIRKDWKEALTDQDDEIGDSSAAEGDQITAVEREEEFSEVSLTEEVSEESISTSSKPPPNPTTANKDTPPPSKPTKSNKDTPPPSKPTNKS